jgi:cytochrome c oxidase cbb3-type subunit 3
MSETDKTGYRRGDFAKGKGEVILRKHEYDGIQEFDQKLPNWWLFTFYGAIALFFGMWFLYYNVGIIPSDEERITTAVAAVHQKKSEALADTMSTLTDAVLVHEWATNDLKVKAGEAIYMQVCIACHGPNMDAPTKLGLSLVDKEWKYGDKPLDIFALINEGTPPESKGMEPSGARMIPYGSLYTPDQIASLVAFIIAKNKEEFEKF